MVSNSNRRRDVYRSSVRCSSVCFACHDISLLSVAISVKLAKNIYHVRGIAEKGFQGQRSDVKVMARPNATMAYSCI